MKNYKDSTKSEHVNVSKLPFHTRLEAVTGKVFDAIRTGKGLTIRNCLTSPIYGYIVAFQHGAYISDRHEVDYKKVRETVKEFFTDFENMPTPERLTIGVWHDGDTVYVEAGQVIGDKYLAVETAKREKQLAIYDLSTGNVIDLRPTTADLLNKKQ